jgi:gliding motility-associated-like protein
VLYESTGVIEVFMFSRQICTAWNQGRAMIGLQNEARDQAIMAPGRKASDVPWGSIDMNESWRFLPASGATLLQRVELYDMAGTMISTGTIGTTVNGAVNVEFPNICTGTIGTTPYRMRAVYKKIDDPTVEIYGNDTIRINRPGLPFSINATAVAATCTTPSSITLIPQAGAGVTPFTYAIGPFLGTPGVFQSANVFYGVAPGLYTAFVQDATGCQSSQNIFVGASPGAITGSATSTPSGCTVPTGTVTASYISGGSTPVTYSIDNTNVFGLNNVFNNVSAGTHTVTIKDALGCITIITVNVGINNNPTATATSTASGCTINNGTITVTALTGLPPYRYAIGPNPAPGDFVLSNVFTNVSIGPKVVTVKDAGGCIVTLNVNVAQTPNPSATATVTATGCGAPSGTSTITASSGIPPYTYCMGATPTACQVSSTMTGLPAGQQYLSVTDANGCVGIVDITIPTSTPPTATATTTPSGCTPSGCITVIASVGTPPYTYALDGGASQASNQFCNVAAGPHTVLVTDSKSCTVSVNGTVAGTPAVTGSATSTQTICSSNTGTITATALTGTAPYTYSIAGPMNVAFQVSTIFNGLPAGAYTVTFKDATGCTGTAAATVGSATPPTATATSSNSLCTSNTGSIAITASSGTGPYQYLITPGASQASNVFNGLAAGAYTVRVTDANGCIFNLPGTVTVGQTNDITVSVTSLITGCTGAQIPVTATTNAGSVSWSPTTGVSNASSLTPTITIGSIPSYTVTAGSGACVATAVLTVVNVPLAIVDAGPVRSISTGDSIRLLATIAPSGTYTYSWSPGLTLNDSTILQPMAKPAATTLYTLTATNSLGCISRDTVSVLVFGDCIEPRNAFTPNGDGINDTWRVTEGGCTTRIEAQVYNRYGGLVFDSRDYRNDWNGQYKNLPVADGTYYFQLRYFLTDGRIVFRRGNVTVVR